LKSGRQPFAIFQKSGWPHLKVAEKMRLMMMVVMISGMEEKVEISYELK
jgi:hypothetical protein